MAEGRGNTVSETLAETLQIPPVAVQIRLATPGTFGVKIARGSSESEIDPKPGCTVQNPPVAGGLDAALNGKGLVRQTF